MNEWAEAKKHYEEAINLDPNHLDSYLSLGNVYFQTGKRTKAKETWE